jgi:hypothetical protein
MTKRMKMASGSGNVFRELGLREPEARNLALRSEGLRVDLRVTTRKRTAERAGANA